MLKQTIISPAIACAFAWLAAGFGLCAAPNLLPATDTPPPIQREFRGLWIATVDNVDWPSKRGLSTRQQQDEMIALLDRAAAVHLNAIFLQVRPGCDAFYESKIEPWSEYLTGKMGQAPFPYYDPLEFAVTEAHKRGLELHAWFNPYRVRLRSATAPIAPQYVTLQHPELVRSYGKYLWLDPTEEGTRAYSMSVILDVLRRYDIDGVHFDDYFFPYPEKSESGEGTNILDFPDEVSWSRYRVDGGKLSRPDWRRENVDQFVKAVSDSVKHEKPWVKFGISPFGIWRPGNPAQITGLDSYAELFADSRKWLAEGWVDYLAPQLYWPIDQKAQSFPVLLQWWHDQNTRRRNLWPGMLITGWKGITNDAREAASQIELTRRQPAPTGIILYHAKALLRDENGVSDALGRGVFSAPALVPACPWMTGDRPGPPTVHASKDRDRVEVNWTPGIGGTVWQWVMQKEESGQWSTEILTTDVSSETILPRGGSTPELIAVTAVSRSGDLSPTTTVKREFEGKN
jgi:uncharacterized lipoprotein YddW (UPF0748 family)